MHRILASETCKSVCQLHSLAQKTSMIHWPINEGTSYNDWTELVAGTFYTAADTCIAHAFTRDTTIQIRVATPSNPIAWMGMLVRYKHSQLVYTCKRTRNTNTRTHKKVGCMRAGWGFRRRQRRRVITSVLWVGGLGVFRLYTFPMPHTWDTQVELATACRLMVCVQFRVLCTPWIRANACMSKCCFSYFACHLSIILRVWGARVSWVILACVPCTVLWLCNNSSPTAVHPFPIVWLVFCNLMLFQLQNW